MNFRELEREYNRKEENFEKTNVPQILEHYDKVRNGINEYGYIVSDTITEEKLKSIENMENAIKSILEFLPRLKTFMKQDLVQSIIKLKNVEIRARHFRLEDSYSNLILIEDIMEEIRGLFPNTSNDKALKNNKLCMGHCINIAEVSELFREVKYILIDSIDLVNEQYDSAYIHNIEESEVVEILSTLQKKISTLEEYHKDFIDSYNNFVGIKVNKDYEEKTTEQIDADNLMYYLKDYIDVYLL